MNNFFVATIFIGSVLFLQCQKIGNVSDQQETGKDTLIVFFNIKEYSRKDLSRFINRINKFEPKIIALDVLFRHLRDHEDDSLLASSFSNAGNVILSASVRNSDLSLIRSHSFFVSSALGVGVISYRVGADSVASDYVPLFENESGQMLSFPNLITANYSPRERVGFTGLRVNEHVQIRYSKTFDNFHMLDDTAIGSEYVKDKIVIFGYFDPDFTSRANSHLATANIILNLLSETK